MKNNLQKSNRKNAGFTLLELVVVVAVMGLISSMAMDVYSDNTNQKRFELTKQRVNELKYAIVGNTSHTINNIPITNSFVADIGKLPENINALLFNDYCSKINYFSQVSCEGNSGIWKVLSNDWNGPYLRNRYTSAEGSLVFKDAWGSDFIIRLNDTNSDSKNDEAVIFSKGLDLSENSASSYSSSNQYERDYPRSLMLTPEVDPFPIISKSEFDDVIATTCSKTIKPSHCP
jgi:prepilin-type N-terminal cleavage/methylation domain-containing protein